MKDKANRSEAKTYNDGLRDGLLKAATVAEAHNEEHGERYINCALAIGTKIRVALEDITDK